MASRWNEGHLQLENQTFGCNYLYGTNNWRSHYWTPHQWKEAEASRSSSVYCIGIPQSKQFVAELTKRSGFQSPERIDQSTDPYSHDLSEAISSIRVPHCPDKPAIGPSEAKADVISSQILDNIDTKAHSPSASEESALSIFTRDHLPIDVEIADRFALPNAPDLYSDSISTLSISTRDHLPVDVEIADRFAQPNAPDLCSDSISTISHTPLIDSSVRPHIHVPCDQSSPWESSNRVPAVRLTGWRMRGDDFAGQQSPVAESEHAGSLDGSDPSTGDHTYQTLAPEELPRMFPDWTLGAPFLFDQHLEEETKGCCWSGRFAQWTVMRWFITVISLIGLSCVVVGVVLGALTVSGNTRLTLCLLMIGVGVVLMIVSGIAWRLTSLETNDSLANSLCCPSLAINGPTRGRQSQNNISARFHSTVPYTRVLRGRTMAHCFPDLLQSDFFWRPPPPSYQTAVRDRRCRNVSFRRQTGAITSHDSPPPTYRSRDADSRPSFFAQLHQTSSRPPSYRSRDPSQSIPMATFATSPADQLITDSPTRYDDRCPGEIQHDDRASLVQNEGSLQESSESSYNEHDCTTNSTNSPNDRLTIIDCSEPVPVGFELRRGRIRSIRSPRGCDGEPVGQRGVVTDRWRKRVVDNGLFDI